MFPDKESGVSKGIDFVFGEGGVGKQSGKAKGKLMESWKRKKGKAISLTNINFVQKKI